MALRILNAAPFPLRQRMVRDTRNAMLIHPLIRRAMNTAVVPSKKRRSRRGLMNVTNVQ
jgi:hypothetical protein